MISDSTGETAQRLVQALEAQFPDQEFSEIRHPRVETVADLQLAVERMKGRPAVVVYTLVEPELRESMRTLCRKAKLALLRPARSSDRRDRAGLGPVGADEAGRAAAVERRVLPPDVGDRVRGQVRRRRRLGPRRGRHRPRRRLAHVEDAALDLPRLSRLQDGERASRQGNRAAAGALHDRPVEDRRADDRRAAPVRDPRRADPLDARRPEVREPASRSTRSSSMRSRCTAGSAAR